MRRHAFIVLPLLLVLGGPPAECAARDSAPVVSVRTVPAVSGLTITFDGRRYVTDSRGRVRLPRRGAGAVTGLWPRIAVHQRRLDARTIVRFARWFSVGTESIAALDTIRRVGWQFVDAGGGPVPTARVERLVLRSTTGEVRVVRSELGRPRWLFSRRVSLIRGKPVLKDVGYAVQRVSVLGSNVVNAGQQTFLPEHQRTVRFKLAFYTLTIRGEDALFGSSVGSRVQLRLPNGSVRDLEVVHGRALATALPRGNYRISLTGGLYGLAQPLLLSRSQVVVVPVVTWLDLLVVGGGLLVVAIGLVLVGRPHLARRAGARVVRRRGSATRQAEQA